jgi:hypothetical protein
MSEAIRITPELASAARALLRLVAIRPRRTCGRERADYRKVRKWPEGVSPESRVAPLHVRISRRRVHRRERRRGGREAEEVHEMSINPNKSTANIKLFELCEPPHRERLNTPLRQRNQRFGELSRSRRFRARPSKQSFKPTTQRRVAGPPRLETTVAGSRRKARSPK